MGGEEDVAFFIIGDFFEENGVVQDLGDFVRKVFFKQNLFNGIKDDEGCKKNELLWKGELTNLVKKIED